MSAGGSGSGMQGELESRSELLHCISSLLSTWKACAALPRGPRFGFGWAGVREGSAAQVLWVGPVLKPRNITQYDAAACLVLRMGLAAG